MGLLKKIVELAINETLKPQSFKKGEAFEKYLAEYIFPEDQYILCHQTHDYNKNQERFVESSKLPDLKFRAIGSKKEFYVEAKYRSSFLGNKLEWAQEYQFKRYKQINRETPVFIAIGVGGEPNSPESLYIIPVSKIKYTGLYESTLRPFAVKPRKPISFSALWDMLRG